MDALILLTFGLSLFAVVAAIAGYESRDGFEHHDNHTYRHR